MDFWDIMCHLRVHPSNFVPPEPSFMSKESKITKSQILCFLATKQQLCECRHLVNTLARAREPYVVFRRVLWYLE